MSRNIRLSEKNNRCNYSSLMEEEEEKKSIIFYNLILN